MSDMAAKREVLLAYAVAYVGDQTPQRERELCRAAWEYAEARRLLASGAGEAAQAAANAQVLVPFGKDRGKPLSAVGRSGIEWLMGAVQTSIDNPDKGRFLEPNQRLLEQLRAELAKRG